MLVSVPVACFVGGETQIIHLYVENALAKKADVLHERHNIHVRIQPHNFENVEVLLAHEGMVLAQELCPFEEEELSAAMSRLLVAADIADMLRLINIVHQPLPEHYRSSVQ